MHTLVILQVLVGLLVPNHDGPGTAQAQLARTLATSHEIRAISHAADRVAFATIGGDGTAREVVATIDRTGLVIAVSVSPAAKSRPHADVSWLATELAHTTVVRLIPEGGAITVVTGDRDRYRIDTRGPAERANAAARARWAAAWDEVEPVPAS